MRLKTNSLAIRFAVALMLLFLVNAAYADYVVGQKFTVTEGMKYKTTNGTTGYYAMKFEVINVKPNGYYEVKIYSDTSLSQPGSGSDYRVRELEIPQFVVYNGTSFTITKVGNLKLGGSASNTSGPGYVLNKVILPPTIEVIGEYAFHGCMRIIEVIGADNLRIIERQGFYGCNMLASLPDVANFANVEEIGYLAFYCCDSLRTANLASIKKLGVGSFAGNGEPDYVPYRTEGLTSLVLGEQLEDSIPENCFLYQYRLTSVEIPGGVEKIGKKAFYGCEGLTSVKLHEGLKIIEESAFGSCRGLTSFEIPASVNKIGKSALSFNINTITVHATTPPTLATQSFNDTPTVYVPTGCRSLYLAANEWKKYNIEEFQIVATGISLNAQSIGFTGAGQTATLTATITPSDATNKDVTWTSSDPTVATVSNTGVVTAVANGTATITATTCDGTNLTASCMVNVTIKEAQTLALASLPAMTYGNAAYTLPATTAQGQTLTWTSSNTSVATISGNTLTIKGAGTATITATNEGNNDYLPFSKQYTLTVAKAALTITADNKTKQQGEANPELTVTYSGFVYNEDASALTTQPTITTTATTDSPAGTYPITASGAAAANYNISYVEGTLTVIDETLLNNRLYAETVSLRTGTSKTFGLKLDNTLTFIACEFYLQLPEGVRIETDEDGYPIAELVSGRINRHSLEVNHVGNGLYHFLCYSSRNNAFVGNSGDLITLTVTCDENVLSDTYTATIKDIMFSDQDKQQVDLLDSSFDVVVTDIIPGDANGDEKINVMDIVEIVGYIMGNSSDTFVFGAADMDENGTINVMDLVNVVSLIMANANQPTAAPRRRSASPMRADATDDELSVADFSIAAGETKEVSMVLDNPVNDFIAFEFWMSLPDGVRIAYDGEGELMATLNAERADGHDFIVEEPNGDGIYHFLCYSGRNKRLKGNSGELISLTLTCADDATVGNATGTIYDMIFSDPDKNEINLADATFSITVTEAGDGRILLDENSTTVPALATNVDVRVKRTIKANEWSTICLPFAMTEEQVKEVFGVDVQLADFTGTEPEFDDEDNCVGVMVNFVAVADIAIEANHPYIIKVSQPISEFTVDGVDIVGDEDEAYIEFDNGKTGSRREVYSGFYGTYHAGTVLDEFTLFLNDNKFWYSKGKTKMKAFRAYFDFLDILTDVENPSSIKIWVNPEDATGIKAISDSPLKGEDTYNLSGQRVGESYKGIVVKKGKKVLK